MENFAGDLRRIIELLTEISVKLDTNSHKSDLIIERQRDAKAGWYGPIPAPYPQYGDVFMSQLAAEDLLHRNSLNAYPIKETAPVANS